MVKALRIRDLTLRDGQQSLFATRMTQAQINRVLPMYKQAHFYAMEVWGGAVPDSIMRYLQENPWERLEIIKREIGQVSKLTALSRGRNLFGYNPYPDHVIEGFCRNSVKSGIDIMRIFDALNDVDNMKATIQFVKENGGQADCAVCYTVDPSVHLGDRIKLLCKGRSLPWKIFTTDYFVKKAKELQALGADIISIKDMAGLITPEACAQLMQALKKEIHVPINLHTHCTPGFGLASVLTAMVNGVDIVDTVMWNFSGGPAAPAYEIIQLCADKLGLDTGINRKAAAAINKELRLIRQELAAFDEYKDCIPLDYDWQNDELPIEIDRLLNTAIQAAQAGKYTVLLDATHRIEAYFHFPAPDDAVRIAQIPGGMYTNMLAQMRQAKLENMFSEVLRSVPRVRLDCGCPPLVTPTSQIVGVQAVNCVVDVSKGKPFYTTISTNFYNLVKGSYGKTPIPIDPAFREKITASRVEVPYDTSAYQSQPNPVLAEFDRVRLAQNEKEQLLLELFPNVADQFLRSLREREFKQRPPLHDPAFEMWENLASAM